jgi:hypothetical protein
LSVVGTERLSESGYFGAKIAQERMIKGSSIPYSIVQATQFFQVVKSIADAASDGTKVRLAPVLIQPMAARRILRLHPSREARRARLREQHRDPPGRHRARLPRRAAAALDARMIEDAVREALVRLRRDGDHQLGQRRMLERERSLVEARTRHILDAVKAGYATTPLLQELEREEARKGAIATELAHLADLARVASLDAAQVSRTLTALAADVRDVLTGAPGPARQMLRTLFGRPSLFAISFRPSNAWSLSLAMAACASASGVARAARRARPPTRRPLLAYHGLLGPRARWAAIPARAASPLAPGDRPCAGTSGHSGRRLTGPDAVALGPAPGPGVRV